MPHQANSAIQIPSPVGVRIADLRGGIRTKLINGDFRIWQREINFQPPGGPVGFGTFYTSDRWNWLFQTDGGSFVNPGVDSFVRRAVFAVGETETEGIAGNPRLYAKWKSQIVGSAGNEISNFQQKIEQVETLAGQKATLSFWAKGAVGGDILVSLLQDFGTGGGPIVQSNFTKITLTTSWRRYVLAWDVPSMLGKIVGANDQFLAVRFTNNLGAAHAASLGVDPVTYFDEISISQVQFEEETVVDPVWEEITNSLKILLVERYYQQSARIGSTAPFTGAAGAIGFETDTGSASGVSARTVRFHARMRTLAPSISIFSFDGIPNEAFHIGAPLPNISIAVNLVNGPNENGFTYDYGLAPLLPGSPASNYQFHFVADAEL